ncbi:MAG: hypothetical protein AAFP13_00340 [Pseudomonadota bacterium]
MFELFDTFGDRKTLMDLQSDLSLQIAQQERAQAASDAERTDDERRAEILMLAQLAQVEAKIGVNSDALGQFALFAMVPPVVLLALGFALSWVLRGFIEKTREEV